ncbi:MAG: carboxypeptidase regulatory-like domain-containing protein, partial [Pirellulaceae bacterium]|nr:carboxypeptidase regulatory-like domain-containing protein [Pirellulaceae bacterium]
FMERAGAKSLTYCVLARKPGRASVGDYVGDYPGQPSRLRFKLRPAATLAGRVVDADGKPIEGALISALGFSFGADRFFSARTDADGRFTITDLPEWNIGSSDVIVHPGGTSVTITGRFSPHDTEDSETERRSTHLAMAALQGLIIQHPGYATAPLKVQRVPSKTDVTLRRAATIEGRVTDAATGKPVARTTLLAKGTGKDGNYWVGESATDDEGRYRIGALPAGEYNVQTQTLDRANVGVKVEVREGEKLQAVDLEFVEGGIIEGRLLDATTGGPLPERYRIMAQAVTEEGKDRTGPATQHAPIDKDGRFRLHVLPGKNYPYIVHPHIWKNTEQREQIDRDGIEVRPGETKTIEFRVTQPVPGEREPSTPNPNRATGERTDE